MGGRTTTDPLTSPPPLRFKGKNIDHEGGRTMRLTRSFESRPVFMHLLTISTVARHSWKQSPPTGPSSTIAVDQGLKGELHCCAGRQVGTRCVSHASCQSPPPLQIPTSKVMTAAAYTANLQAGRLLGLHRILTYEAVILLPQETQNVDLLSTLQVIDREAG